MAPELTPALLTYALLFAAAAFAGAQNALAGGGSFVTFPALLLAGLDPRAANVTSTVALLSGQAISAWAGRGMVAGAPGLSVRALTLLSLGGGVAGALLLLATPVAAFTRLVPWLVLFATGVFAWGSFLRRPGAAVRLPPRIAGAAQIVIAVYGGYFGGGIGILMLAALTLSGLDVRAAGATKNALATVISVAAIGVFVFSPDVHWPFAAVAAAGAMLGGWGGTWLLRRVPDRVLRAGVVALGLALTAGLFVRGG